MLELIHSQASKLMDTDNMYIALYTEVLFDRGEDLRRSPECRPGCRCGRFVEFANSLFIFAEVDEETGNL